MSHKNLRLLYLTAESWPTHRADVAVLFGKYLSRQGVSTDLVTEQNESEKELSWGAGKLLLFDVPEGRISGHVNKTWKLLRTLLTCKRSDYDAIQIRDMAIIGLLGLIISKIKKIPFFYWLSYPQSEGQVNRAKERGVSAGLRYILPLYQGLIGKYLLYNWILPYADHVFVQSEYMREAIVANGVSYEKMTPVPMGVDFEVARKDDILPIDDTRLKGKRVVVYLGTLDRARQIDQLFDMLKLALTQCPNILLVLVGDTEDIGHRAWLKKRAENLGISDSILWTGWVTTKLAWRYVRAAEVGVSICPRGYLLDVSSPTKVIEYFALGVAVLANDNPDQKKVITESKSGLCLPFTAEAFSRALLQLLNDTDSNAHMKKQGLVYIKAHRSYEKIAVELAEQYRQLLEKNRDD